MTSKDSFKGDSTHFEEKFDAEVAHEKAPHVADTFADGYVDPSLQISDDENKTLRRKAHRRILPFLMLAYLCQALDKGTTGTSSIMGWQKDIGAKGQDYALTSTLLWCGIIVGEPIANQFVRRFPVAKILGGGIVIWSALLFGLAFSLAVPPVFAIRFLLGFFESIVGPCLLSLTVQWYRKEEQPFVSAMWQMMLGLHSMIGGILGFAFYHVQKNALRGWQWMTLCIAIFSLISGVVILIWLPDSPTQARWATEEEKSKFVERVRVNNQGLKNTEFKREQVVEAFTDPYTFLLFLLPFLQTLVVGGINTFAPLLINKAFGFSVLNAQLLNIPMGVMTVLMYVLIQYLITKTNQTLLVMIGFTIPNILGTIVLITVKPSAKTQGGLVVAFYAMQVFQACNPAIFLMLSRNSAGHTKKSVTYAITYIGWAGGNAIAPQFFQSAWAPRYLNSLYIHLGIYAAFIATCLVTRMLLVSRNNKRIAAQGTNPPKNELAFEDLTDLQNPDFRYSI
ncbi:hypothetical protein Q8F55_000984 [Vanrija albida]|uniref:Major facilitator superfamily (MFS) profile domain-containing protein n=1 Tax=Vanrija albida TaxID=181172 RepID=A0ABR3QEU7_9TREE